MNSTPQIFLNQIVYNEETLHTAHKDFPILNNLDNLRPDWFEYWPIRNYFLDNSLHENDYYGFLSPKFTHKTSHSLDEIFDYIKSNYALYDVFIFSPLPDQNSFFLNVLEQQEIYDPGFTDTMKHYLNFCFFNKPIENLVMSSRESIFSNYFVAKGSFWKIWLNFTNILFQISESKKFPEYNHKTNYDNIERKVFMQERVASLILATHNFKSVSYKTFLKPWSASKLNDFIQEAVLCDSLKMSYILTGDPAYIIQFHSIRDKVIKDISTI